MSCLLLFRSSVFCFSLFLLLQVSIFSSIAAASVQSDCDLAAEDLRREQAKLKDTANPPDLEDTLQRLKHITDICPNLADGWYFRGRVEQKLGKPADYSLEKARRLNSPALKNNLDPFSPNMHLNNSGQFTNTGKDSSAPQITIISPVGVTREQTVRVKTCQITLKGRVTDESPIRDVEVNGAPVSLDGKNEFSTNLALQSGSNRIFVTATDVPGNKAREEYGFTCEAVPPSTIANNPPNSPSPTAGKQYALVIGINEYQDLSDLQTAVADAEAVARMLEEQFGFKVELLLNKGRAEISSALNRYQQSLDENSRLLVYYAGHGQYDKEADKAYWLPADANKKDDVNWIIADDITAKLKRIKAQHVLIISDSCYSGTLSRDADLNLTTPSERQRYLLKAGTGKSRVLIASGGNEPVTDSGGGKHSVFAAALLRGLREMKEKEFTAEELFRSYILQQVTGKSDQKPEYSYIRNSGHDGGDFIFVRKK